jgi:mannose/fructose/N-acetylgalactosamine-specific phosphotransferase system component IIC
MHDVLLIATIAGLLALDDRAGWQSLLGEPVFSSLLVGLATGQVGAALRCGLALQLVWLSIGAARGWRRPHVVAGGVVGAGAACLVLDKTGDPRELYVIATATFCGLLAGEAGAFVAGAAGAVRERWLAGFRLPADAGTASRNLTLLTAGSALYVGLVDALFVAVALPLAVLVTEAVTGRIGAAAPGAAWWLAALPAFAVATVAQAFASRTLGRFAALGLLMAVVGAWLL